MYNQSEAVMVHHWPKELLIGTAQFSLFGPDGVSNYDYIVTNSINCLLIGLRCLPDGAHTNHR